ncbi:MAG TPA: TPM domain-containing protein [Burkholderiales bacterium]|nr:TPM domain-containing protein [Burkholderiales bacterium]
MRHAWIGWLYLCLLAAASGALAATPAVIPAQTSLLTDEADVLTVDEHDALLKRLIAIQRAGRAQIAVLISKGIDGVSLSDYALRVAESWQLGRAARDDGLLILIVPSTVSARIEVGYGLEGAIPDARASQWLDELLPAIRNNQIANGLDALLNQIDTVLPDAAANEESPKQFIFDAHPEWVAPFVLVVFSPFAIFPMLMGRSGSIVSAFLLPLFLGGAAWTFWESRTAGLIAGAAAFLLPLLWGLNREDRDALAPWLRYARAFGNLVGVAMFFSVIALFTGGGLYSAGEPAWWGVVFAGMLALGLAIFLFPGKPAHYLSILLASAMLFIFVLVVAYAALVPFTPDPSGAAVTVAGIVTAFAALGRYLDSRERRGFVAAGGIRWSLWAYGIAMLLVLPFAFVALIMSIGGEELRIQIMQAAAGGGSIAGMFALAARLGLIAAVKIGLGGRFGGGGAGRSD